MSPVGKSGSTKNIHSIMLPFYVYFFVVLLYAAVGPCSKLGSLNCEELSSLFLFVVLPLVMLFWIARKKMASGKRISKTVFFAPGAIFGFFYAFGWYSMGDSDSVAVLLVYLLAFTFIFAAVSTILGLLFEYFFRRFGK